MRIDYSPTAQRNLTEIGDHYRDIGGNQLARRMIGQIKNEVSALADYPESAPLYDLAPGVRRLVVANGAYLVFYRIASSVQILHVRRCERALALVDDLGE